MQAHTDEVGKLIREGLSVCVARKSHPNNVLHSNQVNPGFWKPKMGWINHAGWLELNVWLLFTC